MSTRSNYRDQYLANSLPVLDALIFSEYDRHEDMIPKIFKVIGSERWGEQTSTMAGVAPAVEKSEGTAVTFSDPVEGFDKTYTHLTYAMATSFTEELIEDDRLNMVEDTYRSLGLAMFQTRQIQSMSVLNDGFSDTGPDGVSLFNSAHTLAAGGTYNNRPSTDIAASVAGIREMEVELMKQVNHRNIKVVLKPEVMAGPQELKHVLTELIKSQDRPDTANRAMNTIYSENYMLLISPFLTSATAWFAFSNKSSHQLRFYERVAPSSRTWVEDKTGSVNTRIRSRFSVGYSDWVGAWGTSG